MKTEPFFMRVKRRTDGLRKLLKQDSPECFEEQKHLNKGTPERIYWHYGYYVALMDVLKGLQRERIIPFQLEGYRSPETNEG